MSSLGVEGPSMGPASPTYDMLGETGERLDLDGRAVGLHLLGRLFTQVCAWAKLASKLAVEPCRKTAFLCTGWQSSFLVSHRRQTGLRLSPGNRAMLKLVISLQISQLALIFVHF